MLVGLLLACALIFPEVLYPPLSEHELEAQGIQPGEKRIAAQHDRLTLQNQARTTLIQGLAGLLVLIGAGIGAAVTLRQVRVSRDQVQAMREQWAESQQNNERQLELARLQLRQTSEATQEELSLSREGQLTERFGRAIDQLGSGKPEIQVGAVYSLERIAKSSPGDTRTVAEVLASYVRHRSPWPPSKPSQLPADAELNNFYWYELHAEDVAAAMRSLGRLHVNESVHLDDEMDEMPSMPDEAFSLLLPKVDLRGINLLRAHLEWAFLSDSHLEKTLLVASHLEGASFSDAVLTDALLFGSYLAGADFSNANLSGADLTAAELRWADLRGANLSEVEGLETAKLTGAKADSKTEWPEGWDKSKASAAGVQFVDQDTG
jgi:hypothetical protein